MIGRRSVILGGAIALAGLAVPALAQSPDLTKLRDELMELEKASWGYMRDKNYDGMKNFLGDDALLIFGDGSRYNKRQTLELMKDFAMVGDIAVEPTYAVRMLSPDIATLLYRVTYTSTVKGGKPETMKVLSSSVYARRDGKWWSVLYQETPIK
jgi:uncharacterized protein (TIGR02246 family)